MIACVLRSGGWCGPGDVLRLRDGCERYAPGYPFICLTDIQVPGVDTIPLRHDWAGWWAKMELFALPEPVTYFDLDTVVTGDLRPLLEYDGPLALLSDFYQPERAQSGVMAWRDVEYANSIYAAFAARAPFWIREYRGDGEWLHAHADRPDRIQNVCDGVYSYKVHCRATVPADARVVCFHGKPKFADLPASHPLRTS